MFLICGDSVAELKHIDSESVDMIFTDPPYRLTSGGCKKSKMRLERDNNPFSKTGECFNVKTPKFDEWLPDVYRVLKNDSYAFIMINDKNLLEMWLSCEKAGFLFCELLVMHKRMCVLSSYFFKNAEFILMFRKGKYTRFNRYGTKTVFDVDMPRDKQKLHPTEKPVTMIEEIIDSIFSPSDKVILDPFMGSGTTGIACLNVGVDFIGIEKDENYFDIAKNRIVEKMIEN